jgi:hypothetical protein
MKKAFCLAVLALVLAGRLPGGDGGQPAAFLKLGVGAREQGMGGLATPSSTDAFAFYYNPALLAALESIAFGSQTSFLSNDRSLDHVVLVAPSDLWIHRVYYGLSYTRFALNAPVEVRATNTADPISTFYDSQSAIQVAVATWLLDKSLALGFNLRMVHEQLGDAAASGLSWDLGALYKATSWLDCAFMAGNLGGGMDWSTDLSEAFPFLLRTTASGHFFDERLQVGVEMEKNSQQDPRFRAGAEYWNSGRVMGLRLGLNQLQWSCGLGLKFNLWGLGAELDYALASDPIEAGALAQRLSLTIDLPRPNSGPQQAEAGP